MTVEDLIAELEQYDRDAEVRVAVQPSWPLACDVQNVVSSFDFATRPDPVSSDDVPFVSVVWIAVSQVSGSGESPYAPAEAWAGR
jgi:hypothetical protein